MMVTDFSKRLDFSPRGRARVAAVTVAGVAMTLVFSVATASYTTRLIESELARTLLFASAVLLPFILSGPVFYFFSSKLRELAVAHAELAEIASRDSLTTCLNRGAFATLVDAYLTQVNRTPQDIRGALLMVDADHFKTVNDTFGHATGDQALRVIAGQIKTVVRANDLVGRLGGEEFAIFLPYADHQRAQAVAERIRQQVAGTALLADGKLVPLTVSVGGVEFDRPTPYQELLNKADAMLYRAKRMGRNRVELAASAAIPMVVSA